MELAMGIGIGLLIGVVAIIAVLAWVAKGASKR